MFQLYIAIMLFQIGALILPGPDFALVFRNSVHSGKKSGLLCALGITVGAMTNLIITYFIGSALYNEYHLIYIIFITFGLAYLYYVSTHLILNFFKSTKVEDIDTSTPTKSIVNKPFLSGLICNISNAKAIVFFSSLLPLVHQLNTFYITLTWFSMGLSAFIWFTIVVFLLTHNKIRQVFLAYIKTIELIIGIAIFTFASIIMYHSVVLYLIQLIKG